MYAFQWAASVVNANSVVFSLSVTSHRKEEKVGRHYKSSEAPEATKMKGRSFIIHRANEVSVTICVL